jgi:hypothetical protein
MDIYVASSWRNPVQPEVVRQLREAGLSVYDFRNPEEGDNGFRWLDVAPDWEGSDTERFIQMLKHPLAEDGFRKDFEAMRRAKVFVLAMPCGRSAHLEAGWAIGSGRPTAILLSDGEPELMYKMASALLTDISQVVEWARGQLNLSAHERHAGAQVRFQNKPKAFCLPRLDTYGD